MTLLVATALGMLGYRFANRDLVAFINDEPRFLTAARAQVHTDRWVTASPLVGNAGVRYGPTVVWFYGLVQLTMGESAATSILAMGAMMAAAHLALAIGLARLFRGGPALFAVLLAWIASSPYQFFFSRLAWDQTVDVCAAWIVFICCWSGALGWPAALCLGAVMGLALGSHPMVVPLVAAVAVVIVVEWATAGLRSVGKAALVAFGAAVVTLPYLLHLLHNPPHPTPRQALSLRVLGEYFLQPARVATTWGVGYFFDSAWPDFRGWLGGSVVQLLLARPLLALAVGVSAFGIGTTLLSADRPRRRVAWIALLVWLGAPFLYAVRTLDRHPHYQFATWWIVPLGVAGTLHWLARRSRRAAVMGAAIVVGLALLQFQFNVEWMRYIRQREGTRGIHYATPLGAQRRTVLALCAMPDADLQVENETLLFPDSLSYLALTEPACRDKRVLVCGPGACPTAGGARRVRLLYRSRIGGGLRLK